MHIMGSHHRLYNSLSFQSDSPHLFVKPLCGAHCLQLLLPFIRPDFRVARDSLCHSLRCDDSGRGPSARRHLQRGARVACLVTLPRSDKRRCPVHLPAMTPRPPAHLPLTLTCNRVFILTPNYRIISTTSLYAPSHTYSRTANPISSPHPYPIPSILSTIRNHGRLATRPHREYRVAPIPVLDMPSQRMALRRLWPRPVSGILPV